MANVIVVGAQWGDEGKGKIVDLLTEHAQVVVRYGGGANAGHTLMVGEQKLVTHLLPSGVLRPGTRCLLGAGMVIDPEGLLEEIDHVRSLGLLAGDEDLGVSDRAHVIFSFHKALDALRESGESAIGTTKRGIGPCYEDKMGRRGVQMWQLADPDTLRGALEHSLRYIAPLIEHLGGAVPALDDLVEHYAPLGAKLAPHLCDSSREVRAAIDRDEHVLFEGAQGALLDIDHGTYPYVTSSSPVAGGACTGVGIGPTQIDSVVGIVKAYQTRVGGGPFPTELTSDDVAPADRELGERLRQVGQEFGATTGRPRRCGWLDVATLRPSVRVNGLTSIALTKLDVLVGVDPLRIGIGYEIDGERHEELPASARRARRIQPIYEDLPGFHEDISGARRLADLPANARGYLDRITELAGVPLSMVSVGPKRQETVILANPFA